MNNSNIFRALSVAIVFSALCAPAHSQLVTVVNTNANDLVDALLFGSGIPHSNETYTGGATGAGMFTGGTSTTINGPVGLGIASGILLSSGNVLDAPGPNVNDSTTTAFGLGGDAQLTALAGTNTNDAAVLQFDFTANAGDDLLFRYVFGSEEYNEFVEEGFNDPFGFFLDGVNIALVSGLAVTIDNINGTDTPGFYNNNSPDDLGIPTPYDNEYDGFTIVFTASALNLTAGQHTIKLAIADASDSAYDSTVFLEGEFQLVQNDPPVADINGPYFADQSTAVLTLDATGSIDDGLLAPLTYSWDLDNDGFFDDAFTGINPFLNIPAPYTFFGGAGVYPVGVQVFDGQFTDSAMSTVTIVPEPMSLLLMLSTLPCIAWLTGACRRTRV